MTDDANSAAVEALAVYVEDVLNKYAPMMGLDEVVLLDVKLAALDKTKERLMR